MRALRKSALVGAMGGILGIAACGWDPSNGFQRESPKVNEALAAYDAGDASAAATTLEQYLATGPCQEGKIEGGDLVRRKSDGSFDLGLSLFHVGESYGRRFGEEELDAGVDPEVLTKRSLEVQCALKLARIIANDDSVATELRARAHYLAGNLLFLDTQYKEAVREYDESLVISPGYYEAGDPIGADAAWNRAIALRRIEDKNRDAGQDSGPDAQNDAAKDAAPDAEDSGKDSGDDSGKDSGQDSGNDGGDSGSDSGGGADSGGGDAGRDASTAPPPSASSAQQPPPPKSDQDERTLDAFENAPSVQLEDAKRARKHVVRGAQDK